MWVGLHRGVYVCLRSYPPTSCPTFPGGAPAQQLSSCIFPHKWVHASPCSVTSYAPACPLSTLSHHALTFPSYRQFISVYSGDFLSNLSHHSTWYCWGRRRVSRQRTGALCWVSAIKQWGLQTLRNLRCPWPYG